jgi:mRNA-degrading endonuclease HigB of HigAB toxin-antitoxin module
MELAVAGQADYLVTRNVKDLLGGRASTSVVVTATVDLTHLTSVRRKWCPGVHVQYVENVLMIRFFGSHKECDRFDAETV